MKKLNKILCLFLLFAMSFSMLTHAEAKRDYSKSVDFLMSIGVLDNHTAEDAENEISRIEFATIIANIVFPDKNYIWYEEKSYTDVIAEYKSIVSALAERGIMTGYDEYSFKPEQAITYYEALKTLVSLTGYDYQAKLAGGYPYGYTSTASTVGLLKNFSNVDDRPLNLGEASKLIENALKIDIVSMSLGSNGPVYSSNRGDNLLNRNLDIYEDEGLFTANEDTNIYGGNSARQGTVIIGNNTYDISDDNLKSFIGHYVEFYYRADEEDSLDRELLCVFDDKKVTTLSITSKEITGYNAGRYKYCHADESRVRNADISDSAIVLYNYRLSETKHGNDLYLPKVGKVDMIDNDGDRKYDIIFVWDYETYVVNDVSAESNMVGDYYGKESLCLDPDEVDFVIIKEDAVIDLSVVEKWNVLSVAKSDDAEPFITVIVSNARVTGEVSSVSDEDITISDVEYKRSPVLNQKINIGQDFDYYLDCLGYVVVYDKNSGSDYTRNGILVRYKLIDEFFDIPPEVLIFTEDGTMEWYPVAEKINFDGIRGTKPQEIFEKEKPNAIIDDKGIIPQMIGYKINKEGELNYIDTVVRTKNETDDSLNQTKFYPAKGGYNYMLLGHTWGDEIAMANGLTIFRAPSDNNGNIYRDKKYDRYYETMQWGVWMNPFFDKYDTYPVRFFNVNETQVSNLMIWYTPVDGSDTTYGNMVVVKSIGQTLNEDDAVVIKLKGWEKGAEVKEYIFEEDKDNLVNGIKSGDIIRCAFNNAGEVMAIEKCLSPETDSYMISSTAPYETNRILYGEITSIDRDHGVIVVSYQKNSDGTWVTPGIVNVLVGESGHDGAVMKYDQNANTMEKGNHSELVIGQRVVIDKVNTAVRSIVLFE